MNGPYFCVATKLRARGLRVLPAFVATAFQAGRAARRTPGNVRTRLLGMPPIPVYWTLTIWESEEAMRAFARSPEHRHAMLHMDEWASRGETVRFTSGTSRVSWRQARRHLNSDSTVQFHSRVAAV